LARSLLGGAILVGAILGFRFLLSPWLVEFTGLVDPWAALARRSGVLLSALVGYWLSVKACERGGIPELRPTASGILWGALSGFALISVPIAALFATGHYEAVEFRGLGGIFTVGGTIFAAAMLEEVLFRGFLFQRAEAVVGSFWALVGVSALFGVLHLFNEGAGPVAAASVTLIGALWTAVFIASRNLWVVGCHHFAWNLAIFCSGVPLSGLEEWRPQAPLETLVRGSVWMTGGSFGPENSILAIVLVGVALIGLWGWAKRNGWTRAAQVSRRRRDQAGSGRTTG